MLSRTAGIINRRIISTTTINSQKLSCRSIHVCRRLNSIIISKSTSPVTSRYSPVLTSSFIRCINTEKPGVTNEFVSGTRTISSPTEDTFTVITNGSKTTPEVTTTTIVDNIPAQTDLLSKIPDAPIPPPPPPPEALESMSAILSEPSFHSLGLGSWWPPGMIQQLFELVHVSAGIPWWGAIVIGTCVVRTVMFPLIILSQRNAAKMHNTLPGMQKIQLKITEARQVGDHLAIAQQTQKLMEYMKVNDCSPIKSMMVPLCQAPVFVSFFLALRGMANLPVESMKHGGLFWFENLTVPDPYYILPVVTAGTLYVTMKLGIDAPSLANLGMIRYVINGIPFIVLPFTCSFPAALTLYWTTTNLFGMCQVALLKIPKLRTLFKIPDKIVHPPQAVEAKKPFVAGFKDSWRNMKLAREMTEREQIDMIQFNKAGRGPIQKTYKYNPVAEHLKKIEAQAKKR